MNAATVRGPRSRIRSASRDIAITLSSPARTLRRVAAPHAASARCGPDCTCCSSRAASAAFDTVLPFTDRMTSPCRSAPADGPSGSTSVITAPLWPDGICSRRAICGVTLFERQAEAAAGLLLVGLLLIVLRRPPAAGCCSASRSSSSTVTFSVFSLLVAQHLDRHRRARLGRDDHLHELVAVLRPGGR